MDAYSDEPKQRHDVTLNKLTRFIASDNIADDLTDEQLTTIGHDVVNEYNIDYRSNDEWRGTAKKSMDAALQVREAKNYPFQNASNVKWPLITVAALQFNARAYPEIVGGSDKIVKAKVVGDDNGVPQTGPDGQPIIDPQSGQPQFKPGQEPGAKKAKADRISEHMSYQLTEEMEGWEEDTDTLLMQIPIVGCAFKKIYYDAGAKQNCSDMVSAMDITVNRATRSLRDAPRVTHEFPLYPNQIEERERDGRWLECEYSDPPSAEGDPDAAHQFLEQHRWIDLDEDGYAEPYIVTVHKEMAKVVRIIANYGADDITQEKNKITRINKRDYFVKFPFIPDPKGGFYDIGFGQLLESLGAAIDTTINQMLDAGHLQNAGGGFIGSGVRLKKNQVRMEPGVYKTVDASGAKLREAIYNMEHPGPSAVLFSLLGMMIDAAKDITAVKDILTGESSKGSPQTATTTLALIEQGMKVFTAIYKRIYRALRQEFKLLFRLNAEHLPEQSYFNILDTPKAVAKADYDEQSYDVCPQADPKLVTDMQRAGRANVLMQFIGNPVVNQVEIMRRIFEATGQESIEALLSVPQPQPDPLTAAKIEQTKSAAELNTAKAQATTADVVVKGVGLKLDTVKLALDHAHSVASHNLATAGQQVAQDAAVQQP